MFINIGTKLNNFHVLKKIGEGGMGEVYLAEDESLGRKVALKVLNPALTADSQFVERFKQEARVQASMNHTNIVQLYSFFIHEDKYIMALEYADGFTLKDLIRKIGPIPEERTIKIFNQICEALQYAHNKNIVHRDIKPSNIMIDSQDRVKIMDFGIAKIMGDMGLTRTGAKVGTLYYMSPEQVMAKKDIDQRTDIYSLGITLFEMLAGQLPFDTDTDSDFVVMNHIVNSNLPDPRQHYPYISDEIISVLYKMTEKDREDRFKNMSEIRAAQTKINKEKEVHGSADKIIEKEDEKITEESIPSSIINNQQIEKSTEEKKDNTSKPKNKKVLTFVFLALLIVGGFFIWNNFVPGRLMLSIEPVDAKVNIDNERVYHASNLKLKPGKHRLKINADAHETHVETIEIIPNGTLQKTIRLTPKYGELKLLVNSNSANIQITQNDMIIKSFTGSQVINDLLEGNYEITANMKGYKSYKGNFNIKNKQRTELNIEMKKGSDIPKNMVYVEGGTFQMGSNVYSDEQPIHSVTLSSFYIGKYELTQSEWQTVMTGNNNGISATPSSFSGNPNRPVERVSWYAAIVFCNRKSIQEGLIPCYAKGGNTNPSNWGTMPTSSTDTQWNAITCNWSANGYRLPTEAEWEYAARGGNQSNGYIYSGSNTVGIVAWYSSNSGSRTHDVGTRAANELGIYDMSGNVWEWCWDWYNSSYYSSSPSSNPRGPNSGSHRVNRGGSWGNFDVGCRVAHRNRLSPGLSNYDLGFRLVRTLS